MSSLVVLFFLCFFSAAFLGINKQISQESKRAFLHSVVNEEGDKEKLEAFVNFCEDTIFEVTLETPHHINYVWLTEGLA